MSTSNISNNGGIKKSVAVWLILASEKKALLQKRAAFDGGKAQSFAGVCQPTWNGKLEGDESVMDGLVREAQEELGEDFAKNFDFSKLQLFHEAAYSADGKTVIGYNYWGVLDPKQLALVRLYNSAEPEFVKINSPEEATAANGITLFEDQLQALKKLFSLKEVQDLFDNKK